MAGLYGRLATAEVACVSGAAKTLVQIVAAANHRIKITGYGIFLSGAASTTPPSAKVRVLRQTTAGTMSALTPVKNNSSDDETIQTTGQHTATVEPTAGDVLAIAEVPFNSGWQVIPQFGNEIIVPGGGKLGLEITLGSNSPGCNAVAHFDFEE